MLLLSFAAGWLGIAQIGLLAGIYPGVWGTAQVAYGCISPYRLGRKGMIVAGMMLQGVAILLLPITTRFCMVGVLRWCCLGWVWLFVLSNAARSHLQCSRPGVACLSAEGVDRLWRDSAVTTRGHGSPGYWRTVWRAMGHRRNRAS